MHPPPTVQLQIIRVILAVIAYRKWNVRAMEVPTSFLRSVPLKRDTYSKLPEGGGKHSMAADEATVWDE